MTMQTSEQQPIENIMCPHYNDVLNGRGKFAMKWKGNCFHRELVRSNKSAYLEADADVRTFIAKNIIQIVRSQNPPGRFLKLDSNTNKWNDIGDKKALRKTRQALVEGSNQMSNSISAESSSDESKYFGTLPPYNHLEFQGKTPNKVNSLSEDSNQSKQQSEVQASNSLRASLNLKGEKLFNYIFHV